MDETPVVTVFLRNRGEVLLLYRSEAVGSYQHTWGGVAGHVEDSPQDSARREIHEETGLDPETVVPVRAGDPFSVTDDDLDTRWVVHPFLFDTPTRTVETNWETDHAEWVPPTAILDRETVPELWTAYDRVRPSVETIASDTDHGSAYVSLRALEVLRDEAALARVSDYDPETVRAMVDNGDSETGREVADTGAREVDTSTEAVDTWTVEHPRGVARELLAARPAMAVVRNRVNRVMATAEDDPEHIEKAAHEAIQRAVCVDRETAEHAAEILDGARVATLSRSGTVLRALTTATPEALLVAESRPGREGVEVAERVANASQTTVGDDTETAVTLTTDAAFAHELAAWDADLLVVGADSILADGRLVNKVGTRGAAITAQYEGIPVLVVTASDKISPDAALDLEPRDSTEVYDGPASVSVANPTFDLTPPDCIDSVVTEHGKLDSESIRRVTARHQEQAEWGETPRPSDSNTEK